MGGKPYKYHQCAAWCHGLFELVLSGLPHEPGLTSRAALCQRGERGGAGSSPRTSLSISWEAAANMEQHPDDCTVPHLRQCWHSSRLTTREAQIYLYKHLPPFHCVNCGLFKQELRDQYTDKLIKYFEVLKYWRRENHKRHENCRPGSKALH